MLVWLLHQLWHHDTDYVMMPPALRPNVEVPWDLHMEEFPKLWWNTTYINWKAGCPSVEVGVTMTLVSTNHQDYDSRRLVLDISDAMAIWYLASTVDEESGSDGTAEGDKDEGDEDDSDDEEDLDEDLQRTVREVANKTDNSGFRSGIEDNPNIEALAGSGIIWTTFSSQDNSNTASWCGASFNAYLQENASWSSIIN